MDRRIVTESVLPEAAQDRQRCTGCGDVLEAVARYPFARGAKHGLVSQLKRFGHGIQRGKLVQVKPLHLPPGIQDGPAHQCADIRRKNAVGGEKAGVVSGGITPTSSETDGAPVIPTSIGTVTIQ